MRTGYGRMKNMWVQSYFIPHIWLRNIFTLYKTWKVENILTRSYSTYLAVQFVFALLDIKSRKHISTIIFHSACLIYAIRLHSTGHGRWKTFAYPHTPFSVSDFVVRPHSAGHRKWKTLEHFYFIQHVWLLQFICTWQDMESGKHVS
jgi:hypothetical protein